MTASEAQDVVDILTTDHHDVLDLIGQISSAARDQRRDMADTAIAEVVRHSVAEEMYVYPVMRERLPDGDKTVQHDIEEHQQLEEIMKELEGVEVDDARFLGLVSRFKEALRHHASDEESEQFPMLRAHIPAGELVELGSKVETAKTAAPTRPHPSAPHSELFHKMAGPGVGMIDRLRDKLAGRSHKV
jgi:hemerythrin superfamily protein